MMRNLELNKSKMKMDHKDFSLSTEYQIVLQVLLSYILPPADS